MLAALLTLGVAAGARANVIQDENTFPGDNRWTVGVTNSPAPTSAVDGYTGEVSVAPGGTLSLKVQATARYRIEIERLGWYGGAGGRRVGCVPSCLGDSRPPVAQPATPAPDPATGIVAAGWSTTDTFTIPANAPSGYYVAIFVVMSGTYAGRARWYPFVVRPPPDRPPSVLVDVPVNTWQAYNNWGGKSLYGFNSTDGVAANHVSFDRPLSGNANVFAWEIQVVRFLERNGYDVGYVADTDVDANPSLLVQHPAGLAAGRGLVMAAGHGEYWSKSMRDAYDAARDAGVNLAFMGADMADWQVRYEDGRRTLVEYRTAAADPIADPTLETTHFRDLVPPRPQCQLLGVEYQGGATQAGDAPHDYELTQAGAADPWVAGTGLGAGATFLNTVGYEWDAVKPGCAVPPVTPLFHWAGRAGTRNSTADAVTYAAPSGARVFSTGSLQFTWLLDGYHPPGYGTQGAPDAGVQQFFRNLVDATAGGPPETAIDAAPADPSNDAAPSIAFSSPTATRFECRLDGTAWRACGSPTAVAALGEGRHSFEVRGLDALGAYDQTPARREWTVDTTPPETWIRSAPAQVTGSSASFAFESDSAGAAFQCRLDAAAYAPCGSPQRYDGVSDGEHTFGVRAVDAAGNVDGSEAVARWTVDATAPDAPSGITTAPASPSNRTALLVAGHAEPGSSVRLYATPDCSGDPLATGDAAAFADGLPAVAPRDATTTYRVTATDAAGNASPCSSGVDYTEDSTAPPAPAGVATAPASPSAHSAIRVSGQAEAGSSVSVYAGGACDGAPVALGSREAFADGLAVTAPRNSTTTYRAAATDPAGNVSDCSAGVVYRQDDAATATTVACDPPTVTLGASARCTVTVADPASGGSAPTGAVAFGSSDSGVFGGLAGCTLTAGTGNASSCAADYTPSATGSGAHTISATYGGDESHGPSAGEGTLLVGPAPTAIDLVPSLLSMPVGTPETLTATVSSTLGTPIGDVAFEVDGSAVGDPVPLDSSGRASLTTSALPVGEHSVAARFRGAAAFAASDSRRLAVVIVHDRTAPAAPAASASVSRGSFDVTWSYTAREPSSFTLERRDASGSTWVPVAGGLSGGGYSFAAAAPEAEGRWTYRVRADFADGAASDYSAASDPVVVDRTPPTVAVTGCPRYVVAGATATVDVAAADAGAGLAANGDPSGTHPLDTSSPGSRSVDFQATDGAGNSRSATCAYVVRSPYAAAVFATPGLLGYWRLGEPAGTSALDSAGTADGSYEAPVALAVAGAPAGDADAAARFAGGRVRLPDLGQASDFTIEGLEKINSASQTDPIYGNNTLYGQNGNVRLLPRPGGVYAGVWVGGSEYWLSTATASNLGVWVHWALVREGATLTIYRNGQQVARRADLPAGGARISGSIGRLGNDCCAARADVDEVAVYTSALAASAVQRHQDAR